MRVEVQGRSACVYTGGRAFDPALPTVLMIHGAQQDHSIWGLQSRYLAHHGYGVLAPDLPGHGRSEGPPCPSVESMAQWVIALASACGAARLALVGHSMGALVAIELASRVPERVSRLALTGANFPMTVSDALLSATRDDTPRALDMINQWSFSGITHRPGSPGPGFAPFVANMRLMQRQPAGTLFNDFNACNAYAAGLERAAAIACPVLYLQAGKDLMTPPKTARALVAATPGAQVTTIEGAGHNVMAERPDAVLRALAAFLSPLKPKT